MVKVCIYTAHVRRVCRSRCGPQPRARDENNSNSPRPSITTPSRTRAASTLQHCRLFSQHQHVAAATAHFLEQPTSYFPRRSARRWVCHAVMHQKRNKAPTKSKNKTASNSGEWHLISGKILRTWRTNSRSSRNNSTLCEAVEVSCCFSGSVLSYPTNRLQHHSNQGVCTRRAGLVRLLNTQQQSESALCTRTAAASRTRKATCR